MGPEKKNARPPHMGTGIFVDRGGGMFCRTDKKQIGTSDPARSGHVTRRGMTERALKGFFAAALWLVCAGAAHGAIIINAPMTDTNAIGWTLGGNPTSSLLTGDGTIDPVGQGWLRLTNNTGNQTGFAYNNTSFDLSQGVLIQFDYATWGGSGADGYSVYLFDAGVTPFNIGAFGGSLGYAQKLPPAVATAVPGISGGYVGIGVDEYGNFSNPTEGRYLGPGPNPNTVTVRGPIVGFGGGAVGQTTGTTSYPWIATSANNGSLWYNGSPRPDQTSANYRKVVIEISPAPNPAVNVWVQFGYNQPITQMITNQALPAISTSQLLKIGYAASTGGATNYHEIRNLLVTSLNTSTAIDLGITKSAVNPGTGLPLTSIAVGSPIRYIVTARNYGPNNVTATGVGIVDTLPADIDPASISWTCAASGGASCGAASGTGNLNTTANLPLNGIATYTIDATLKTTTGSQVTNTASLTIPAGIVDYNPNNNSASATFTVAASVAGTGTKPLYLYNTTTLSRTQPPAGVFTSIINDSAPPAIWAMTPGAAAPITISPTVSANIPVKLYLSRNTDSGDRDVTATLQCTAPGSTPISQMRTLNLTGTVTAYNFTLPPTGSFTAQTCAPPYTWNLKVSVANSQANSDGIRVYTSNGGNPSHADLPVTTVINVNSIGLYNAAYPGGSAITSVTTGSTVYIRAVVSDPFGSYDIVTAPTITIKDPSNNTLVNAASMSLVAIGAESPSLTKTFQYQYTVPASPAGNWSISVKATEGTETSPSPPFPITNTGYAAMPVVAPLPNLTVLKYAFGVTSGASAKPGQEIPYLITVSNTGPGVAGNVVVQDCLSPYSAWTLNTFTFADGVAPSGPSGLSLTGSTMYYSYDNGTTWTTTPPTNDGTGHAPTVTCWKLVMDPAKSMNANPSSFTLNYQAIVK